MCRLINKIKFTLIYEYGSDTRSYEHYSTSSENKTWKKKNSGQYGIWTNDLCDTGAELYQLS